MLCVSYYLSALAVLDTLVLWSSLHHLIVNMIPAYKRLIIGPWFCKLFGFFESTAQSSSIWTIVTLSLERFISVYFPLG